MMWHQCMYMSKRYKLVQMSSNLLGNDYSLVKKCKTHRIVFLQSETRNESSFRLWLNLTSGGMSMWKSKSPFSSSNLYSTPVLELSVFL